MIVGFHPNSNALRSHGISFSARVRRRRLGVSPAGQISTQRGQTIEDRNPAGSVNDALDFFMVLIHVIGVSGGLSSA
jgi:hypothetical protein